MGFTSCSDPLCLPRPRGVRWTGAIAAAAQPYVAPLILTDTTYVKARVQSGAAWSALTEAVFHVPRPLEVPLGERLVPFGDLPPAREHLPPHAVGQHLVIRVVDPAHRDHPPGTQEEPQLVKLGHFAQEVGRSVAFLAVLPPANLLLGREQRDVEVIGELLHTRAFGPVAQAFDRYLVQAHLVERLYDVRTEIGVDPGDRVGGVPQLGEHLR